MRNINENINMVSMQINIEHMHTAHLYDANYNFGYKLETISIIHFDIFVEKLSQKNSSKLKHAICFPNLAQNVFLEQFRKFVLF